MCFIFKIKAGAKFPVIQMKTESFREGMARDSAEEGERLWGWDGVNTKAEKAIKKMTTIQPSRNLSRILAMRIVSRDRYERY